MRIAIFDLDGTITRRDSLTPYVLGWLRSRPAKALGLVCVLPALLRFALRRDAGALKSALIHHTLGGASQQQISDWNAIYVPKLLRTGVFTAALRQIEQHRQQGDFLILMSASVDLYVPAIAQALQFNETICTTVRWNDDQLDGALTSVNCRGNEKLRQLERLRARHPGCQIEAYGNSAPDLPHLRAADRGILVNGGPALRRLAQHDSIGHVIWR